MKNILNIKDESGKKREFRILVYLEDSESDKNYVVYTENKKTSAKKIKAYASTFVLSDKGRMTKLKPIEKKEEFEFIEKVLDSLQKVELGGKN